MVRVLSTTVHGNAHNRRSKRFPVSLRGMDGVHWRFDSEEGLILGETIAVRILQQVNTRTQSVVHVYLSPLEFAARRCKEYGF